MISRFTVFALLCCLALVGTVGAEPPSNSIAIEFMREKGYTRSELTSTQILEIEGVTKSERLSRSGVELYQVNRHIPGLTDLMPDPSSIPGFSGDEETGVAEYFEVVSMKVDGETRHFSRAVPPEEIARRKVAAGGMTPGEMADFMETYSGALLLVGGVMREEMPFLEAFGGFEWHSEDDAPDGAPTTVPNFSAGQVIRGVCGAWGRGESSIGLSAAFENRPYDPAEEDSVMVDVDPVLSRLDNSWLSPDPLTFLTGPACVLQFGAEVLRATDLTEEQKKAVIEQALEETNNRIQLAGRETVDGRPTYRLEMSDLGVSQTMEDGAQIDFNNAALWIDEEYFVRRKMRMEGVMHAEGESREFFLESLDQDYRNVPNSQLYEPHRTVMRTGGMITPEQQREMQKTMAELEKYDREMAKMPAAQRAMVERMMGDKIEQARSLATGGAVEFKLLTTSIVTNPDFSGAPSLLDLTDIVREIQRDLTTLGYNPGPINGQMNPQTASAIEGFEADQGMPITGEATPEIAEILRVAIQ